MDASHDKPQTMRKHSIATGDVLAWIVVGAMLAFLLLFTLVLGPAMNRRSDRIRETELYVTYAQEAGKGCPPIASRMKEILSDARVTDEEAKVIGTLIDQSKAQPGGLKACRYERWHNIFGN